MLQLIIMLCGVIYGIKWVHVFCNNLPRYCYRKLQKDSTKNMGASVFCEAKNKHFKGM